MGKTLVIYFINILLLSIFGIYFTNKGKNRTNKIWLCFIAFIQLSLLSMFRINIGIDYKSYKNIFNEISILPFNQINEHEIEIGYGLLNKIVSIYTDNFGVLIAICSIITVGIMIFVIYKNSTSYALSIYLYVALSFYYMAYNLTRQGIAISITIVGIKYIKEKKLIKYLLVILLASTFHYSALIMIPIYFISRIKLTNIKVVIFSIITFILHTFLYDIINIGVKIFPQYSPYVGSEFFKGVSINSIVLPFIIFIVLYLFKRFLISENKTNQIYINMSFYSLLLSILQTKVGILDRLPYYFNIFSILSLPILINCFKTKSQRILATVILIIFGITYNIYYFTTDYHGLIPYQSIFN